MKNILVTGGAGFIGSNLIKSLLRDNQTRVYCLDNFDPFYPAELKKRNIEPFLDHSNFTFIEGDIRSYKDLNKVGEISTIVHLAAKAGVRPSLNNPISYINVNVNGTQNLLDFAVERGIKQFVFASSSSVYGINPNVPWKEDEELIPISPYASTKLMGEMMGQNYSEQYGIRFIALRFFTVYGPGQRPDLAINKFFKAIYSGQPLPIFGNGNTRRDYTFVDDTVQGIRAALDYDKSNFEIINLGNNRTVSLLELIRAIENCLGQEAVLQYLPEQEGDVPQTYASIDKARRLLGYNPQTPLDKGLKHFHSWLKENEMILQ